MYSPYRLVAAEGGEGVGRERRGACFRKPSLIVGHAVTRIGLYIILQKTLSGNDTRLRMMTGTTMTLRALAQRVDVHLVQELLSLTHCEQFARLLALAA